jgi:hypothetical protein
LFSSKTAEFKFYRQGRAGLLHCCSNIAENAQALFIQTLDMRMEVKPSRMFARVSGKFAEPVAPAFAANSPRYYQERLTQ